MKDRLCIISADRERLRRLIRRGQVTVFEMPHLQALEEEIDHAEVIEEEAIPFDIVTLGSEVLLKDMDSGDVRIHRLVLPGEARGENDISILTPLGVAMLGSRAGDILEFPAPLGVWRLKVLDVLSQPEPIGACCK